MAIEGATFHLDADDSIAPLWQVETDWGWYDYDANTQEQLNRAHYRVKRIEIRVGKWTYEIDFTVMTQVQHHDEEAQSYQV